MLNDQSVGRARVESPSSCGNLPVLTVITPSLNAVDTIGDTLRSVSHLAMALGDQGLALEHRVIDGGSRDGTLVVLERYQSEHAFCHLTTGIAGGPYAAMNLGLSLARGQFTHVLNADDLIWDVPGYVALLQRGLAREAQILLGSIVYFKRPGCRVRSLWHVRNLPYDRERWRRQLRRGLHYPHPGFLAKTEQYRREGFDLRYSLSADYRLMQALLLCCADSDEICVSEGPVVAMAEGGLTGGWRSIASGYYQLREINRELGINAPAWRRYLVKLLVRYLSVPLYWFKPVVRPS